jgi:hypothetical protein
MVEKDLAEISTIRKMVLKHDLTTERDVTTEVVPFLQTETKRLLKCLDTKFIINRETARGHDVLTLFKDAILLRSFCAVSSAARALLTSAVISSTDAPCLLPVNNGHANFIQHITHRFSRSFKAACTESRLR